MNLVGNEGHLSEDALAALQLEADNGRGIIVGVVGTGCEIGADIENLTAARDFTGSASGQQDRHGSGTYSLSILGSSKNGIAPSADFVQGKGLSDTGTGAGQWVAGALGFVANKGASVILLNAGGIGADSYILGLIRELAQRGVWVVCPWSAATPWPAESDMTISVGGSGGDVGDLCPEVVAGALALYRAVLKKRQHKVPDVYGLRNKFFASVDGEKPDWVTAILADLGIETESAL